MESGIYGIPSINVGNRQRGRVDNKKVLNIQNVDYNKETLRSAIDNIEKFKVINVFFGKGNSSNVILELLCEESFWSKDIQKVFYDLNLKNIR